MLLNGWCRIVFALFLDGCFVFLPVWRDCIKSLSCQTVIVIKVPDFPSFFPNILLKISARIQTPTYFKHAMHVHANSVFDKNKPSSSC